MKKKIQLLTLLWTILLLSSGCAANTGARVYNNEELIKEDYNTFNLINSSQSIEENRLSGSADVMEGMGTIWKFETKEAVQVTITYEIHVSSGKAKLVLISPKGTLTAIDEFTPESDNQQETTALIQAAEGENRIKLIGGKNTKISFEFSADKGNIKSFGS